MDLSGSRRNRWQTLLLLVVASRLSLQAVGVLAVGLLPKAAGPARINLVYHRPAAAPLEIWARWDAEWYLLIAERGYDVGSWLQSTGSAADPGGTAGFFPVYPLLLRLLSPLAGGVGAGVLISNLALAAAALLLYRFTRDEAGGGELGDRAGTASVVLLLLHPMSLFLSAVYAESLFLALSLAALVAVRAGRPITAAVSGALAAATRPLGILLVVPLAIDWWQRRRLAPASAAGRWGLLVAAAPAAGMVAVLAWSARTFGDPFAFMVRQARWRGSMGGPWRAFVRWWETGPELHGAHGSTLELVIALVCLAMLVPAVRTLSRASVAYAAVCVLVPLSSTLWSFGRLSLTVFPLFAAGGIMVAKGARTLPVVYGFAGGAVGALLMALYAAWWWAG